MCKTQSLGCIIALCHCQGVVSKAKTEEKSKSEKRKASEVEESKEEGK
jgi:hypothetical protein